MNLLSDNVPINKWVSLIYRLYHIVHKSDTVFRKTIDSHKSEPYNIVKEVHKREPKYIW